MIARLSGTLVEKGPGSAVVDVAGVGYHLAIPLSTYYELGEPGSRVALHVHTHVREDTLALYGFSTRLERALFALLIGINGIGPKTALAALSGLGSRDLIEAVRGRDATRLSSIPGIGRKTAERILLDLADRLGTLETEGAGPGEARAAAGVRQDLVSALVNLGYNARAVGEAVGCVLKQAGEPAPPFQTLLRQSLKILSG
jgi:Holliday junction DNA helicase RuvA